jgi:hypothetical protein
MRFFGFGKKRVPDSARPPVTPFEREEHSPHAPPPEKSSSTAAATGHAADRSEICSKNVPIVITVSG